MRSSALRFWPIKDTGEGSFWRVTSDLHNGKRLGTFLVLSREACEVMSRPYPDVYRGWFIDLHIISD